MTDEPFELIRGSGNVFRDFGDDNADLHQLKAILAAAIIKRMDKERMTVRGAAALTGVPAADFSRIRHANLSRFTADRLLRVLDKLGSIVEITIKVKHKRRAAVGHV